MIKLSNFTKNIIGQRFGKLIALIPIKKTKLNKIIWKFICDCGKFYENIGSIISNGYVKSCGCNQFIKNKQKALQKRISKIGQWFTRLQIIDIWEEKDRTESYLFLCVCVCGNLKLVNYFDLKSKNNKSCGCLYLDFKETRKGKNGYNWNQDRDYIQSVKIYRQFFNSKFHDGVKFKSTKTLEKYFGYTYFKFKIHIESLFANNMSWENYGKIWQIDHIYPISAFIKNGIKNPKIINSLPNLRPLLKKENYIKRAKIDKKLCIPVLKKLIKKFPKEKKLLIIKQVIHEIK